MAEEQYVSAITKLFENLGHASCSTLAVIASFKDPDEDLVNHVRNGGELGSDIQIPRKMLPEFNRRCMEANIKFQECDRDAQSEFVTIVYKGAMDHRINDIGDYEKKDGKRIEIQGDTKRIKEIAMAINNEYIQLSSKDYMQTNPLDRPVIDNAHVISGLDRDCAVLLKEQLASHFVESNLLRDEEKGCWAVEFDGKHLERVGEGHLSIAESAMREAWTLYCDDRVTDYMHKQSKMNQLLIDKIEAGEFEGVIYEPRNILKPDSMGLMDIRDAYVSVKGNKASVHIKDTLSGTYIEETLDLRKDEDKLRLFHDLSIMDGKTFVSEEEFARIQKMHNVNLEEVLTPRELQLVRSEYERASLIREIQDFENTITKKYGGIEAFRKQYPDHEGLKRYDELTRERDHILGYDDPDLNMHFDGVIDKYFTKADLEYSEYKRARVMDPRLADSMEPNALQYEPDQDIMKEIHIEGTDVNIAHTAIINGRNIDDVSAADRQRLEQMLTKQNDKLAHMKIECGARKEIIGDTHSYDRPVASATAQEFAVSSEAYYEQGLDKQFGEFWQAAPSEEEWAMTEGWANEYNDPDHDEAEEVDPFGNDKFNGEEFLDEEPDIDGGFWTSEEDEEHVR